MSAALLDVSLLIALFDPLHPNRDEAHAWFKSLGDGPFATCPITQNRFLRILSNPRYSSVTAPVEQVAEHLRALCQRANHRFWPDDLSILDEARFRMRRFAGPRQITDIYLLALAVSRGGHLVTLDRSIPWQAVEGAKLSHLRVLGG
jgi:hypothetical protein